MGTGVKALVVDDETSVREVVAEVLELRGMDVRMAASVEEALPLLEPWAPDLVLSDLRMPGASGFDLLVAAKERDRTVAFVLMTGFGDVDATVEALRLGADDFLQKPLRLEELDSVCGRALAKGRLLKENLQQKERLEHLYRVKSLFLASMSHELRTPLTTIIGMSEVLSERVFGELNKKQAQYMASIEESARHLLGLINDILDFSKVEAGKMTLEVGEFAATDAVATARAVVDGPALRRGVRIETLPIAPGLRLRGDRGKVVQVLVNLLSNAVKFSPEESVVTIRCVTTARDVRFAIEDHGPGIPRESLDEIFQEFQQLRNTASGKDPGTGLGLALSRRLAELHGGGVQVESVFGSGSTFTLVLPRTACEEKVAVPA